MNSSPGSLILILMFGGTSGNSVQQTDQITVLEGASVTMNCIYTSTQYPTLFWYIQYPNKALQFLQRETVENSKNFGARNIKDKNSPITKSTVQMSDSAVYYCLLRDTHSAKGTEGKLYKNLRGLAEGVSSRIGVSGAPGVAHNPQYLTAREGDPVTITCSYSIGMTALHWLQQNPGGRIVSLFILSLEMKEKGRVRATINTEELHSSLYITASQPRDSATYLCAVGTQCSTVIWSPYPNSAA